MLMDKLANRYDKDQEHEKSTNWITNNTEMNKNKTPKGPLGVAAFTRC